MVWKNFSVSRILQLIRFYPPYLGAGVRVKSCSEDMQTIEVQMKMRFWNKNYMGTHFGGSLYSMTDPWYMFILIQHLGKEYYVWDKEATIRFKYPGKGTLTSTIHISDDEITRIKTTADSAGKAEPKFTLLIKDQEGKVVAEVDKLVSVRRKDVVNARRAEREKEISSKS